MREAQRCTVQHHNVVSLLAIVLEPPQRYGLLFEYAEYTCMLNFIHDNHVSLQSNRFSTTASVDKKFELMLTRRAKAYSSSCSQTVSLFPVILSRLLRRYRFLMPSCAGFLEPRKSRLGPSKFTFNAENFICSSQLVHVYLNWFRRNSLLKCVAQFEIAKKSIKTSILAFKVIHGH